MTGGSEMYTAVLMMALTAGAESIDHGRRACHGCSACYGCTTYYYSCHGCSRSHGCHRCSGCHVYYGCHGCHGGYSCCGGVVLSASYSRVEVAAPATIVVSLPAGARLTVDGAPTRSM